MSEVNNKAGQVNLLLKSEPDITTEQGFNEWVERFMKRQRLSRAAAISVTQSMLNKRLQAVSQQPPSVN